VTRELSLHNPFGLVHGVAWDGLAAEQPDPTLCAFVDDLHGLRAGMLNFLNMAPVHGLTTIAECITRASPPPENPTAQYIANVCEWAGSTPDTPIRATLMPFFKGCIRQENGVQPFPDDLLAQALELAVEAL
jgi:hypothetical protein